MISQSEMPLAILGASRLVPLVTIERLEDAVPLARALVEGGLPVMEVALRTPVAAQAIAEILRHVPQAAPIAGNVLTAHDLSIAAHAGARMAVSPVATPALLDAAAHGSLPFMPGVATPSELMLAITKGFHVVKFFPAMGFGGPDVREVRRAEWVHWASCLTVLPLWFFNPWWLALAFTAVVLGANGLFILVLRHNRVRLLRILTRG